MPKSGDSLLEHHNLYALDDSDLEDVSGGAQVVFDGEGVNRDSWFVSFLTRRMIENRIRREMDLRPGVVPEEIEIEGRIFKVISVGETIHVEELT